MGEKICDVCQITLNKNAVPGDVSALSPGGVRIGTPALTTRGLKEADFEQIADMLDRLLQIGLEIQSEVGKPLKKFIPAIEANAELKAMREEVRAFATRFPMPG